MTLALRCGAKDVEETTETLVVEVVFFDRGDSKWSPSPSISSVINPLIGHIIQLPIYMAIYTGYNSIYN